nr:PREDICTED: homeobox-leucine zipper protein HAT4-like [Nicotiana tabacum]
MEDLGLSLSLSFPQNRTVTNLIRKTSWTDNSFPSSDRNSETCRVETKTFLKGIDVNRLPETADAEEEAGVSSPNSTISSVSGNKRNDREANCEEHDMERACSRGISDEEDGETCRKKLRLTKEQSAVLEENFKEHSTLNPKQKLALAKRLGLRARQVEVWFQNRRAR